MTHPSVPHLFAGPMMLSRRPTHQVLTLIALSVMVLATARVNAQETVERLRVGSPDRPPFASQSQDGSWQGLAVDLWRMVAEELGIVYEIVRVPSAQTVDALAAGRIDVAIAIDATPRAEFLVDFMPSMYTSTIAVATMRDAELWRVVSNLLNRQMLEVVAFLVIFLFSVGAVIWALERRNNPQQFHKRPLLGLGDGFWWAGVTLTTIGYGDKTPKSFYGRAVAMVWMLVGLGMSSALTASIVSATNLEGGQTLAIPSDLTDKRVGAISGSTSARYLYGRAVAVEEFATFSQAFTALRAGKVDAVAGANPELRTAAEELAGDFVLSFSRRDPQYVSIALAPPVTLNDVNEAEAMRRTVLTQITSDGWWRLVARYIPEADD
ncbi:MAG: transporter substrate-binding domain-containing protein [Pseudomonadota bacterium]